MSQKFKTSEHISIFELVGCDLEEGNQELDRHSKEWTEIEPQGPKDDAHQPVDDKHGHLKEPFTSCKVNSNRSRRCLRLFLAFLPHLVDPRGSRVMNKLIDMSSDGAWGRSLDSENSMILLSFQDLFANFSARDILSKEIVIKLSDDSQGYEVLDNIHNTVSKDNDKVADHGDW